MLLLIVQVQKISILGGGCCETQKCKEMCGALSEFPEGWGLSETIPSMGNVWIFPGTTHCNQADYTEHGQIDKDLFWNI